LDHEHGVVESCVANVRFAACRLNFWANALDVDSSDPAVVRSFLCAMASFGAFEESAESQADREESRVSDDTESSEPGRLARFANWMTGGFANRLAGAVSSVSESSGLVSKTLSVVVGAFESIKNALGWTRDFLFNKENARVIAVIFLVVMCRVAVQNIIETLVSAFTVLAEAGFELFGSAWEILKSLIGGLTTWISSPFTSDEEKDENVVSQAGGASSLLALAMMTFFAVRYGRAKEFLCCSQDDTST